MHDQNRQRSVRPVTSVGSPPTPSRSQDGGLYERLLGDGYATLHPHVRDAHEPPLRASGTLDVVHGRHPLTGVLVRLMKLPAAGPGQAATLRVSAAVSHSADASPMLTWKRQIGAAMLETRQFMRRGLLVEAAGTGRVAFVLRAAQGAIVYEQASIHLAGMPLPAALAPHVHARVAPESDGWSIDVTVDWRGALICRYWGRMHAEPHES